MSSTDLRSFDDPALKRAIQRVWGQQTAPAELRRRVAGMVRESGGMTLDPSSSADVSGGTISPGVADRASDALRRRNSMWGRKPLFGVAAAAVVLAGVGSTAAILLNHGPERQLAGELGKKLVFRHEQCCQLDNHHLLPTPKDDYERTANELRNQLGHPVLARPIGPEWRFRGAAPCPVTLTMKSGHLVYTRGNDSISLFSLPPAFLPAAKPQTTYDAIADGHPIAGFAQGNALFFLVASSPSKSLTESQLRSIRDQLRGEVVAAAKGMDGNIPPAQVAAILGRILH